MPTPSGGSGRTAAGSLGGSGRMSYASSSGSTFGLTGWAVDDSARDAWADGLAGKRMRQPHDLHLATLLASASFHRYNALQCGHAIVADAPSPLPSSMSIDSDV